MFDLISAAISLFRRVNTFPGKVRKNCVLGVILLLVFVSLPSVSFAATDVYYSVGTNAMDLKNGPASITICSGIAIFNISQPDNIGIGDKITYVGKLI